METTNDKYDIEQDVEFSDDIKIQELQSCKLIYPDSKVDYETLSGIVSIPINIEEGITVRLYLSDNTLMASRLINYLPPFELSFQLNDAYPYDSPPQLEIKCVWLDDSKLEEVTTELNGIWKEYKDQVLFNVIDYLQDLSQNHIDKLVSTTLDILNIQRYYQVIDFDLDTKVEKFNMQTFTCEICQTDLKGLHCTKFDECGHVFCNNCLIEYFQSCIISGEIDKVHCPDYECTKKYLEEKNKFMNLDTWMNNDRKARDVVNHLLTPSVPLTMLNKLLKDQELVKRYYTLFKKGQYELIGRLLPNRMVTCPRIGCDEVIFREDLDEKLVVCPKCKYAFCNDCRKSYHARFKICTKISEDAKYLGIPVEDLENYPLLPSESHEKKILNAKYGRNVILRAIDEYKMDQLFQQLIREGTDVRECPGCHAVIEKTEGCNKMKCSECKTSFCFNCGSRTANNYDHFTDPESPCYKLLFFGMPGVDDDDL